LGLGPLRSAGLALQWFMHPQRGHLISTTPSARASSLLHRPHLTSIISASPMISPA